MTVFETETCDRCGGTGMYSYCETYGRTCFQCRGRKVALTKRGRAARQFFDESRKMLVADLKPGMWLWIDGVPGFSRSDKYRIESIEAAPPSKQLDGTMAPMVEITAVSKKGEHYGIVTYPNSKQTVLRSKAENDALIEAALIYQASLTKTGKPRKGFKGENQ